MSDDTAGMDMGHDHEEAVVTEWEGSLPQLEVVIRDDLITLEASRFDFADPSETEPRPGRCRRLKCRPPSGDVGVMSKAPEGSQPQR